MHTPRYGSPLPDPISMSAPVAALTPTGIAASLCRSVEPATKLIALPLPLG